METARSMVSSNLWWMGEWATMPTTLATFTALLPGWWVDRARALHCSCNNAF